MPERGGVGRAPDLEGERDVVGAVLRVALAQQPESLLFAGRGGAAQAGRRADRRMDARGGVGAVHRFGDGGEVGAQEQVVGQVRAVVFQEGEAEAEGREGVAAAGYPAVGRRQTVYAEDVLGQVQYGPLFRRDG